MNDRTANTRVVPGNDSFSTTQWSVVFAAASDNTESRNALESLCRAYWPPIYAYIRRTGYDGEQSRDLTQQFFVRVIEGGLLAGATPERGRFRSYLLGALKHFLADFQDWSQAQKRGGGREVFSLDAMEGESSYCWEPADDRTPDKLFERRWALTVMVRALQRLEEECRLAGKGRLFASLRGFLSESGPDKTYPEIAGDLGMTEAGTRMAVARLRRRLGEFVRAEVAETLGTHADLEDELRHLLHLLREC